MKQLYFYILLVVFIFILPSRAYSDNGFNQQNENILYIPTIMIVADDEEAAALESQGVIIWHRRADMAVGLIPATGAENVPSKTKAKLRKPWTRKAVPAMDIAKTHFNASSVITGKDLPQPYTGKGVVVGFCDTGFDPHHINFVDSEGKSRVKRLVFYDELKGIRKVMDSPAEIASWVTDDKMETHATHVAGIMTGSFSENGYGGMAPDADIVGVTSQLYDAGILSACEDIIEYARSVGKPAVINLSIGSYNGPHDGSTLFNRYMSLLGEEAIICLASGNEGKSTNSCRITFDENNTSWKGIIHSYDWIQFDMLGMTDIWSSDERPINFRFRIYDELAFGSVYESPLLTSETDYPYIISSDTDPEFANFMTGTIMIDGYHDENNGRWVTEMIYETHTDHGNPYADNAWARYNLALEVSGAPGVHADITTDGQFSRLVTWSGYKGPGSELSVSDLATGDNVICVGMYANRSEIPLIGGSTQSLGYSPLEIFPMSGYATLIDGRVLPHSVAPGAGIISSASSPYLNMNSSAVSQMSAMAKVNDRNYYWNVNTGTSMSTPYLAGVVATWLEADPSLNIDDVKHILAQTNATDVYDPSDPRNGRGWLQPYEGMKMVVKNTGLNPGKIDAASPAFILKGNRVEILNPSGQRLTLDVYDIKGFSAMHQIIPDNPVSDVDLSSLPKGMYIISVSGDVHKPIKRKIIL